MLLMHVMPPPLAGGIGKHVAIFNARHASTASGGGAPQGRKGKVTQGKARRETPIGPSGPLPPSRGKHIENASYQS